MKVNIENKVTLHCEVAESFLAKWLGLKSKTSLSEKEGMLFLFEDSDKIEMTMLGMAFSIDMIFVNENKVIRIKENVQPGIPAIACKSADSVIEVKAGFCKKYNIEINDYVDRTI